MISVRNDVVNEVSRPHGRAGARMIPASAQSSDANKGGDP